MPPGNLPGSICLPATYPAAYVSRQLTRQHSKFCAMPGIRNTRHRIGGRFFTIFVGSIAAEVSSGGINCLIIIQTNTKAGIHADD
jgi:hypothetical protein